MSILVVGSIALDTIETPAKTVEDSLGGSTLYFSAAARFFAPVNVVGVVGEDFDFSKIDFLKNGGVDLSGIAVEKGKTFRWGGRYYQNINQRDTLFTDLNVFETFNPQIPAAHRKSPFVFLANIAPELQLQVLAETESPRLTVLDTMNFWISGAREALDKIISKVDVMILNDEETRQLTGMDNLQSGAAELLKQGPRVLVIKKGEHGAIMVSKDDYFVAPAFPLKNVADPTGAGDSFAGGFVGYLAGCDIIDNAAFRKAVIYGSTVASFNVEDFSFNRLKEISRKDIEARVADFKELVRF